MGGGNHSPLDDLSASLPFYTIEREQKYICPPNKPKPIYAEDPNGPCVYIYNWEINMGIKYIVIQKDPRGGLVWTKIPN